MAKEAPKKGASKRPPEIDDLYRIRLVGDPQASPDGKTVAFVQTRLRKKKNDYGANIWLAPADGSASARKFTNGPKRDMLPRWSPSGDEMAFVSTRSGKPQIWIISAKGGEARQLTYAKRGVGMEVTGDAPKAAREARQDIVRGQIRSALQAAKASALPVETVRKLPALFQRRDKPDRCRSPRCSSDDTHFRGTV